MVAGKVIHLRSSGSLFDLQSGRSWSQRDNVDCPHANLCHHAQMRETMTQNQQAPPLELLK